MADWAYCGKSWAMNPDDVPHAPSALDAAYSRRIRCVRMRAKFTATASEVDQGGGVYQKDDSLGDWIGGGEATSAFWTTVLMPFIRKFTEQDCGEKYADRRRRYRRIPDGSFEKWHGVRLQETSGGRIQPHRMGAKKT